MNRQEIFTKAVTHMLAQGQKAYDDVNDRCAYRDDQGRKCAVGALIPDHLYSDVIEGTAVCDIDPEFLTPGQERLFAVLEAVGIDTGDDDTLGLLKTLQGIHDGTASDLWPTHLANLAEKLKLEMPQ